MLDNILASNIHISTSSLQIFCIAVNIGKAPALIKSKIKILNKIYSVHQLYRIV